LTTFDCIKSQLLYVRFCYTIVEQSSVWLQSRSAVIAPEMAIDDTTAVN